jgi:hypothetical protein
MNLFEKTFTMGGNYPIIDRSFNTSIALGNLLDDTLPNHNDYEYQQRSMMMMNGLPNIPQWSIPQMNLTSTPVVR